MRTSEVRKTKHFEPSQKFKKRQICIALCGWVTGKKKLEFKLQVPLFTNLTLSICNYVLYIGIGIIWHQFEQWIDSKAEGIALERGPSYTGFVIFQEQNEAGTRPCLRLTNRMAIKYLHKVITKKHSYFIWNNVCILLQYEYDRGWAVTWNNLKLILCKVLTE